MKTDVHRDLLLDLWERPLARLAATFGTLLPYDSFLADSAVRETMGTVLDEVADRMGDNYPYFHPLYGGQMMKPPHAVARAAYAMAINRSWGFFRESGVGYCGVAGTCGKCGKTVCPGPGNLQSNG